MLCCIFIVVSLFFQRNDASLDESQEFALGHDYYAELKQLEENSYGTCWTGTMKKLKETCNKLNQIKQRKLAFELANCFLEESGIKRCECNKEEIPKCLSDCDEKVFYTFTEFFTHIYAVCHFLQQQHFRVEMAKTALLLKLNTERVNQLLIDSAKSQDEMVELQKNLIEEQKKSISNSKWLTDQISKSRKQAKYMYKEFTEATTEQKHLIIKIFDRLRHFETFVLGELTVFHSILYFVSITVITYILTSVPRTYKARFYMISLIVASAVFEKYIQDFTLNSNIELNIQIVSETLSQRIWISRYACCLLLIATLIYCYVTYEDITILNNRLLHKIYAENKDFQTVAKNFFNAAAEAHPAPILDLQNPAPVDQDIGNPDEAIDDAPQNEVVANEEVANEEPQNEEMDPVRKLKNIKKKLKEVVELKEKVDAGIVVPNADQQRKLDRWAEIKYLLRSLGTAVEL